MNDPLPHPTDLPGGAPGDPERFLLASITRCLDPRWHFRLAVPRTWRIGPQGEEPPVLGRDRTLALFSTRDPDADLEIIGRTMEFEIDPADWLALKLVREGRTIVSTRPVPLLSGVVGDAVATWEIAERAWAGRFFATKWGPRLFELQLRTPLEHYPQFADEFFLGLSSFAAQDDSLGLFSERVTTFTGERPVPFEFVLPVSWQAEPWSRRGEAGFEARPVGATNPDVVNGHVGLYLLPRSAAGGIEDAAEIFYRRILDFGIEAEPDIFVAEQARKGFRRSHLSVGPAHHADGFGEARCRVLEHSAAWVVAGTLSTGPAGPPLAWMRVKRALDIVTGTLAIGSTTKPAATKPPPRPAIAPPVIPALTPGPDADWAFHVVEHAFVVRQDRKTHLAERLMRDGRWVPFRDLPDIIQNGRAVPSEAEALALAERLFVKYPELP